VLDHLLVAPRDELTPHLVGESAHLVLADRNPGHAHRVGGITERGEPGGGGNDALHYRGTEGVLIQPQERPQGEKVPATRGTVGDPFDLLNRGPLRRECAGVRVREAGLAAVGARGLFGHLLGLLGEHLLEDALGHPLGRCGGDLLHRAEVHI